MKHPGGRPRKIRLGILSEARELHARGYSWRQVGLALGLNPGSASKLAPKASINSQDPPGESGSGPSSIYGSYASPGETAVAATGASVRSQESNTSGSFGVPRKQERTTAVAPAEGNTGIGAARSDGGVNDKMTQPNDWTSGDGTECNSVAPSLSGGLGRGGSTSKYRP